MIINKIQEFCIHLFQINNFVIYYKFVKKSYFLITLNSEFQAIEVWLTDKSSQQLEIEDKRNLTLITK